MLEHHIGAVWVKKRVHTLLVPRKKMMRRERRRSDQTRREV